MENLNDVAKGTYVALPAEIMVNVMNTMDLCVQALLTMDPQDSHQNELKNCALASAYSLINQHNELH
tara:strand:- start:132 stop:332 length:201 start_codon:yes stop_codon:yes gene_type:complete